MKHDLMGLLVERREGEQMLKILLNEFSIFLKKNIFRVFFTLDQRSRLSALKTPIGTAFSPFCKRISTSSTTARSLASISPGKLSFGGESPTGGSYTTTE